jgi:hypothetical protein
MQYNSDKVDLPEVEYEEGFSSKKIVIFDGPSKSRLLKALASPRDLNESTVAFGLKLEGEKFFGPTGNKYYHAFKVVGMTMADDIGDEWFLDVFRVKDGSKWRVWYSTVDCRTPEHGPFLGRVA